MATHVKFIESFTTGAPGDEQERQKENVPTDGLPEAIIRGVRARGAEREASAAGGDAGPLLRAQPSGSCSRGRQRPHDAGISRRPASGRLLRELEVSHDKHGRRLGRGADVGGAEVVEDGARLPEAEEQGGGVGGERRQGRSEGSEEEYVETLVA